MNPIKLWNLKSFFGLVVWGLQTTFGPLSPRKNIQLSVQNPSSTFHKQDLIFSRAWDESNKIKKSQKKFSPWGLGPRNYVCVTWTKKTYPPISPELTPIFINRISFSPEFLIFCHLIIDFNFPGLSTGSVKIQSPANKKFFQTMLYLVIDADDDLFCPISVIHFSQHCCRHPSLPIL